MFFLEKENKFLRATIYLLPVIILGVFSLTMNLRFISLGMLDPNFDVIFESYRFNLIIQPILLVFFGLIYLILLRFVDEIKLVLCLALFCLISGIATFAFQYYVTVVEPQKCLIKYETIATDKLTKPISIVHFTDIQSAGIGEYEASVFKKISALSPDLILYTGDFLQLNKALEFDDQWEKLLKLFKQVKPRFGIYAVFGDTELELYSKSAEAIKPIKMLSSKSESFEFEGGKISLHGLSLYQSKNPLWAMRSVEKWQEAHSDLDYFRIIMGHAPDYALALKDSEIDLCLAGHTHGGQVKIPLLGPLVIDSKIPKRWAHGFNQIGLPALNVSAGVGSNRFNGLPPIRFNCPTELTLIELVPIKTASY